MLSYLLKTFFAILSQREQEKQRIAEVNSGVDDAESLISKMDLEAFGVCKQMLSSTTRQIEASADQKGRLMMSTERMDNSSSRIKQSRRNMLATKELGVAILSDMHQPRQSLFHANNMLHGVDDSISRSRKILNAMSRRMNRNKWIIDAIIIVLVIAVILVLYFKLAR